MNAIVAKRSFLAVSFLFCMLAATAAALYQPWYVLAFFFVLMLFVLFSIEKEWALHSLLLASFCTALYTDIGPVTVRPDQVIALVSAAALLPPILLGSRSFTRTALDSLILAYLFCNLFSSLLHSPDRQTSLQRCLLLAITFSAYFITTQLVRNETVLWRVVKVFLIAGVLEAIYGIVSVLFFAGGVNIGGAHAPYGDLYARGTFLEGNIYGSFQMMLGLILFSFLFGHPSIRVKGMVLIGIGVVVIAMIMSYTRAAWIGFALGLMTYLLFIRRGIMARFVKYLPLVLISLILLAGFTYTVSLSMRRGSVQFFELYKNRVKNIFDFKTGTGALRVRVWKETLRLWKRNPVFGNGTDSVKAVAVGSAMPKFAGEYWIPNSVLLALHDTGVVGFVVFCAIQIVFFLHLLRASRKTRDPSFRILLEGFCAAFVGVQVTYFFTTAFWFIFIWVFMAVGICAARLSLKASAPEMRASG